jgi:hypothetical protein
MIIQFPDAAGKNRLLLVRKIAEALRAYLADGPKSASACRKVANHAGGFPYKARDEGREEYEGARRMLDLWCIYANNIDLALPAHGRKYAGFDERGDPIAWPINGGRPKSIAAWNSRKA